jgi:hypothetical protein
MPSNPGRRLRETLEALKSAEASEVGPSRRKFADLLKDHRQRAERKRT